MTSLKPPEPTRRALPIRRLVFAALLVVLVAVVCVLLLWKKSRAFLPGTLQAAVLSTEETSGVLGMTLRAEETADEPPPALDADPATCAVAVGPATRAVYGRDWTQFWSVAHQDSESSADHVVVQSVARYADADKSDAVFRALVSGLEGCTSATRGGTGPRWFYVIGSTAADAVSWTAMQDAGDTWSCHRQARLTGDLVAQVAVCQAGNGGPAASEVADKLVERLGR